MNIQDSIIFFMVNLRNHLLGETFAASGAMVGSGNGWIFSASVCWGGDGCGRRYDQGRDPGEIPSALEKPVYVGVSVITALAIFILLYIKQDLLSGRLGTFYDKAMLIMDSVGLGIFTSLGVMSGIDNGYPDNSFLAGVYRNAYRGRRRSDA